MVYAVVLVDSQYDHFKILGEKQDFRLMIIVAARILPLLS